MKFRAIVMTVLNCYIYSSVEITKHAKQYYYGFMD